MTVAKPSELGQWGRGNLSHFPSCTVSVPSLFVETFGSFAKLVKANFALAPFV